MTVLLAHNSISLAPVEAASLLAIWTRWAPSELPVTKRTAEVVVSLVLRYRSERHLGYDESHLPHDAGAPLYEGCLASLPIIEEKGRDALLTLAERKPLEAGQKERDPREGLRLLDGRDLSTPACARGPLRQVDDDFCKAVSNLW